MVSKGLEKQTILNVGRNVVELAKVSAGTHAYSCGTRMCSGRIVVIQPSDAAAS